MINRIKIIYSFGAAILFLSGATLVPLVYSDQIYTNINNNLNVKDFLYNYQENALFKNFDKKNFNLRDIAIFIIEYCEKNNLKYSELSNIFRSEIRMIYNDFNHYIINYHDFNYIIENSNLYPGLTYFIKNEKTESLLIADYWTEYRHGKLHWDGYLPTLNGSGPSDINLKNILWRGDNFDDWWDASKQHIFGSRDTPLSVTELLNIGGGAVGLGLALWSLFTNWSFPAALGIFGSLGIVVYDFIMAIYFLAGIGSYLNLQWLGSIEIIINIVNETEIGINSCIINASSLDADKNLNDFEYYIPEEFQYRLGESLSNKSGWYSLTDRIQEDQINEMNLWEQAVPPPGEWKINITPPEGYIKPPDRIINLESRRAYCYNITLIKIEEE